MKVKLILSLLCISMSLSVLRADDSFLWEGGVDQGDGWKQSNELGEIYTGYYPWIWVEAEESWLWFWDRGAENDATDVWCWDHSIEAWRWQNLDWYAWTVYWTVLDYEWVYLSENSYYLNSRGEDFSADDLKFYCAGMAPVAGGTFTMGDSFGDGASNELPLHDVTLSSFYMGRTQVTNAEVAEVLNWANGEGLLTVSSTTVQNAVGDAQELLNLDDSYCQISWDGSSFVVDSGKESYPCMEITWYGSVAYANYLSEQEGLTPCYDLSDWSCDFTADGYRLPTESEWEFAARGGLDGARFPWGDTITHEDANYNSSTSYNYDVSTTSGYHPDYNTGTYPYTSPVGSFASNGYGLYDMSGNVWEWCWDWYGSYSADASTDPTGPASGSYRVARGGSWYDIARSCRVAYRGGLHPDDSSFNSGFRLSRVK